MFEELKITIYIAIDFRTYNICNPVWRESIRAVECLFNGFYMILSLKYSLKYIE